MRSGQQKQRGRGRNSGGNNNRKGGGGGNPLSRSYDSTGPDVKIRGTAQHIAEKYMALARDAQSSSDNVMAENYLQHAEHYNRIVAAAQAQMQERYQRNERDNAERDGSDREDEDQTISANGRDFDGGGEDEGRGNAGGQNSRQMNGHRPDRGPRRDRDDAAEDGGERRARGREDEARPAVEAPAPGPVNGSGPQPVIEGTPAEVALEEEEGSPRRASPRRKAAATRPRRTRAKAEGENEPRAGEGEADTGSTAAAAGE